MMSHSCPVERLSTGPLLSKISLDRQITTAKFYSTEKHTVGLFKLVKH